MKVCACEGSRRRDGFTDVGTKGQPWWVCAGCLCPTLGWAQAMEKLGRTDPREEVTGDEQGIAAAGRDVDGVS